MMMSDVISMPSLAGKEQQEIDQVLSQIVRDHHYIDLVLLDDLDDDGNPCIQIQSEDEDVLNEAVADAKEKGSTGGS